MLNTDLEFWFFIFSKHSYHDNAFVTSRALHIVSNLNASATFPLLEWFFKHQVCIHSFKINLCPMHALVEDFIIFAYSFGYCELGLVEKGVFHFPSDFDLLGPFQGLVNFPTLFFPPFVIFCFHIRESFELHICFRFNLST